jgi:hypothetical protein
VTELTPPSTSNTLWTHVVIPDTQVKPGVRTEHLTWIGQYLVDKFAGKPNVRVIHLGDHADMPSLSSYDTGKKAMEGRRVTADIQAANAGFTQLNYPLYAYNDTRRQYKERQWWPDRHILLGNHEDRITRATEDNAQLDGLLSLDSLDYARHGWTVHPYLKPTFLDGVGYAHYWSNPMTGRPYGGSVQLRLKTIGHSFTMGHQQTLDYALRYVAGKSQHGLVAGACYLHDEDYKGWQGNAHWRGIVVKHQVDGGSYDPSFISLDFLCRKYEGIRLSEFLAKNERRAA